jgi:hypothetical protein
VNRRILYIFLVLAAVTGRNATSVCHTYKRHGFVGGMESADQLLQFRKDIYTEFGVSEEVLE